MRRIASTLLAAALPLSLLAFAPSLEESGAGEATATADGDSTVLTPDPIEVTMYLHGDDELAKVDDNAYAGTSGGVLPMDREAPDGDYETKQLTNYAQGPNARCAGNGLLPVWQGFAGQGTITGPAVLDLTFLGSTGGQVVVDVFVDVSGQACNEAYPEPVATAVATLPMGEGDLSIPLELDGVRPGSYLMVQLRGADSATSVANPVPNPGAPTWPGAALPTDPTAQGRVVYDGADFQSRLTFTCQPDDVVVTAGQSEQDALAGADCLPY